MRRAVDVSAWRSEGVYLICVRVVLVVVVVKVVKGWLDVPRCKTTNFEEISLVKLRMRITNTSLENTDSPFKIGRWDLYPLRESVQGRETMSRS